MYAFFAHDGRQEQDNNLTLIINCLWNVNMHTVMIFFYDQTVHNNEVLCGIQIVISAMIVSLKEQ